MRLNVKAFALTCGLVWGLGLFCLTWWIIAWEGATGELTFFGYVYRGFNISPTGSIVGLILGFYRRHDRRGNIRLAIQLNRSPSFKGKTNSKLIDPVLSCESKNGVSIG